MYQLVSLQWLGDPVLAMGETSKAEAYQAGLASGMTVCMLLKVQINRPPIMWPGKDA